MDVTDPISNKASFETAIEFIDDDTGEAVSLLQFDDIIVTISTEVSAGGTQLYGYDKAFLTLSLVNGDITLEEDGMVAVLTIGASLMATLPAQTYDIGCRMLRISEDLAIQTFIGKMPVVEGL